MNSDFLIAVLSARAELTHAGYRVERHYVARLHACAASLPADVVAHVQTGDPAPGWSRLKARIRKRTRELAAFIKAAALLPSFIAQARRMSRLDRRLFPRERLIVATASNRLPLTSGARGTLRALLTPLGDASGGELASKVIAADTIVVCDPSPLSAYWRCRHRVDDDVFVVDGAFLCFWFVLTLPAGGCEHARCARACARSYRAAAGAVWSVSGLVQALLCGVVASTYARLFGGSNRLDAVFLTSHSMLTELLRAYLLECDRCREITEAMHGIGSLQAERFISTVILASHAAGAADKLRFVPQIPGLPLYGVFKAKVRDQGVHAINAYLNRYVISRTAAGPGDRFIDEECRALDLASENPVIVTLFGYSPTDGRLFDSPAFRLERLLLTLIGGMRQQMAHECTLVYVPHPLHASTTFDDPVFAAHGVRICRDSVFTWLVSDLCISLASSAMFEAAHFGAEAFTPMLAEDDIFTEAYLDAITHPQTGTGEALLNALREFMLGYSPPTERDVISRARDCWRSMSGSSPRLLQAASGSYRRDELEAALAASGGADGRS